jgi:hypothetical protein
MSASGRTLSQPVRQVSEQRGHGLSPAPQAGEAQAPGARRRRVNRTARRLPQASAGGLPRARMIMHLDAEVANGALKLGVSERELHRSQIPVRRQINTAFVQHNECVPNLPGSSPMLATHSRTTRAYDGWSCPASRRPGNSNAPALMSFAKRIEWTTSGK